MQAASLQIQRPIAARYLLNSTYALFPGSQKTGCLEKGHKSKEQS
jgi:hypothetical protein